MSDQSFKLPEGHELVRIVKLQRGQKAIIHEGNIYICKKAKKQQQTTNL